MDTAHKNRWEISEVVFGIPFLMSIVMQWLSPLSLPNGVLTQGLVVVGIVLILIGAGFIVLARREFARFSQSMEPGHSISQVVHTGVFSISRNPLYLGIIIAVSGIGLVSNILWFFIFLVPATMMCYVVLIAPEERYLANKFGEQYLAYAAWVHRWLGRR